MGAIRDVLRVADCRRIEAGWFASLAGELAGSIALLVYAYNEGGAPLVALYGVAARFPRWWSRRRLSVRRTDSRPTACCE